MILVDQSPTTEEVVTLEIPYDQAQIPLEIPYDMTPIPTSPYLVIPLVIIVPSSFLFDSTKVVPWNYDSVVYIHGKKVEDESLESKEEIVNITGTCGITKSGRVFAHIPPPYNNNEV